MSNVIKDGKEVIEWEKVNLTYHADGNVGIGTPPQVKSALMASVLPPDQRALHFHLDNRHKNGHEWTKTATSRISIWICASKGHATLTQR